VTVRGRGAEHVDRVAVDQVFRGDMAVIVAKEGLVLSARMPSQAVMVSDGRSLGEQLGLRLV
jgi:hypothetical protein